MSNRRVEGVSIRNASKQYETFCALDGVSLDVAPSGFVSILNQGKLVQIDMPERLHNPSRRSFVGQATLAPVGRHRTNTVQPGDTVLLCLPPQHIIVVPRAPS